MAYVGWMIDGPKFPFVGRVPGPRIATVSLQFVTKFYHPEIILIPVPAIIVPVSSSAAYPPGSSRGFRRLVA